MNNIYLSAFLIMATFSCIGQQNGVLSVKEFQEKILENGSESVVVDLRTTEEMEEGYISEAIQLDFHDPNFNEKLTALDRDKIYLLYCKSGGRSGRTFTLMEEQGFKKIYDLKGGFKAWESAGMAVEKPKLGIQ